MRVSWSPSCCDTVERSSLGVREELTRGLGLTCHIHCGYDQSGSLERPCKREGEYTAWHCRALQDFYFLIEISTSEALNIMLSHEKKTFSDLLENTEEIFVYYQ